MTAAEKKKRNQVILLVALSAVLLAVVYWQYLLSPALTACDDLTEEIYDNETRLSEMQNEVAAIPGCKREIDDVISRISEKTADLYPVMNTEDADIMLLKSMTSSGLSAASLSVTFSTDEESSTANDTGVYVITANYVAHGSYSSLLSFISKVNEMPAVVISFIEGTAVADEEKSLTIGGGGYQNNVQKTPASESSMEFNINAQVYMYLAPDIPEHFDEPGPETLEINADSGNIDDLL